MDKMVTTNACLRHILPEIRGDLGFAGNTRKKIFWWQKTQKVVMAGIFMKLLRIGFANMKKIFYAIAKKGTKLSLLSSQYLLLLSSY
jgi:hypothetical protein